VQELEVLEITLMLVLTLAELVLHLVILLAVLAD
jgi:hypothetical protein